jgi:hypothetical protein
MQSNSLTMGFCVCVGLLLALHSIPVVEDILVGEDTPVVAHILVVKGILAVVHILVGEDTPVVDTLEAASAALQIRIAAAHVDHHLSHALPLVAVQMAVLLLVAQVVALLLVVQMAAPGCS